MNTPALQRGVFLALLALITCAFVGILMPFFGAVLWSVALAILFTPSYRFLLDKMGGRRNLAALVTLALALVLVIFPLVLITISLVQDVLDVTQRMRAGDMDLAGNFQQMLGALPAWASDLLDRLGLGNVQDMIARATAGLVQAGQAIATQAISIGQNTFGFLVSFFIMMYLLFFLLRDGLALSKTMRESLPLSRPHTHYLLNKFTAVIRATVKGNMVVALVQGSIGGLSFWVLGVQGALVWAVLMAFLSLLPAVGAALIWGPVALYFIAIGQFWQGGLLVFVGVFVIGLVDNILRPLLVGKDTRMPDYVVLTSTIGGMAIFGLNGFVLGPVIAALFIAAWSLFVDSNEADGDEHSA